MACETRVAKGQTLAERMAEVRVALVKLEASLQAGQVTVVIGPNGAVGFKGWGTGRSDITDVCAVRTLQAASSWAFRQALSRAEAQSGRKMNPAAVAAGHHTHDGKTWHSGH